MNEIQNTSRFVREEGGAYLLLAEGMAGESPSKMITDMEKSGQRQLVASHQLPAKVQSPHTDADFEALGFTFGPPVDGDPLFRAATLPQGWSKQASDHDMWSYVVDERGRRRVAVFYKAAFYDRRAFMGLESVESYVSACRHQGKPVATDDAWATPLAVARAARRLAELEQDSSSTWRKAVEERPSDGLAYVWLAEAQAARDAYLAIAEQAEQASGGADA